MVVLAALFLDAQMGLLHLDSGGCNNDDARDAHVSNVRSAQQRRKPLETDWIGWAGLEAVHAGMNKERKAELVHCGGRDGRGRIK